MGTLEFAKGHGTKNDFVLVADPDDRLALTPELVRALCDRRVGVGADGVLRAVRGAHVAEWAGEPGVWFMDYRNADGSVAEMCGNGLRVFARYLADEGLADGPSMDIGTRAGLRRAVLRPDGLVDASMGQVRLGADVEVALGGQVYPARAVDVGNPHAVAFVPPGTVDGLDLSVAPSWQPAEAFPDGVNCEFAEIVGSRHIKMRVFERGVGETFSCGTGIVASAALFCADAGDGEVEVDVRGGRLTVTVDAGQATLTGPAVVVAHGTLDLEALGALA